MLAFHKQDDRHQQEHGPCRYQHGAKKRPSMSVMTERLSDQTFHSTGVGCDRLLDVSIEGFIVHCGYPPA